MLTAITRAVSPTIDQCELSFLAREPISVSRAVDQHRAYQASLASLGLKVIELPPRPDLPDAVFVEDTAIVLDELAVILRMGARSRRPEVASIAEALSEFRTLHSIGEPSTIDGGDVMRIGHTLYVGKSARTNARTNDEGGRQLAELIRPFGYEVRRVRVNGCLHLKSGCCYVGRNSILLNRSWVDSEEFSGFELIDVPTREPAAGNALLVGETVILPASFPETAEILTGRGFSVQTLDVSEIQKAEGGVTCCSLIFED